MTKEMTCIEFVAEAIERLLPAEDGYDWQADEVDNDCVLRGIEQCFINGFSLTDTVRYMHFTEHVSPDISEDRALFYLGEISKKYRNSKDGPKKCS